MLRQHWPDAPEGSHRLDLSHHREGHGQAWTNQKPWHNDGRDPAGAGRNGGDAGAASQSALRWPTATGAAGRFMLTASIY